MEIITSEKRLPKYIRKIFKDSSLFIQAMHVPIKLGTDIIHLPYLFRGDTVKQVAVFLKTSDDNLDDAYINDIKACERILAECTDRETHSIIVGFGIEMTDLIKAQAGKVTVLNAGAKGIKLYRND